MIPSSDRTAALRLTQTWLERFVVGLELCPFARPLVGAANLRIAICEPSVKNSAEDALTRSFLRELDLLQSSSEAELATTLLVFTQALAEFDDYLDFLHHAQSLLISAGLEGLVQLASFHPDYRFAGECADAAGNFSNRAPYPIIHLLREDMITRALQNYPDAAGIPERNIETLSGLGAAELQRRWAELKTALRP